MAVWRDISTENLIISEFSARWMEFFKLLVCNTLLQMLYNTSIETYDEHRNMRTTLLTMLWLV